MSDETPSNEIPSNEIIYVADPMCSWCWGFAPVARALERKFAEVAPMRLMLGGLRPGARSEPLDASLKATIRPHWERVEALTGQPFNYALFDRAGFQFDTEPASRAVIHVRRTAPALTLPVFFEIERRFYVDNADVTSAAELADVVADQGADRDGFLADFESEDLRRATYADFTMARRLGAEGFPTVILRKRDRLMPLTVGYRPLEDLEPIAERYFA